MEENQELQAQEKIINVDIEREMKKSFLDYSMSVIVSRALPDVRDGLKPVHRRILYTMFENNLYPDRAYVNVLIQLVLYWADIIRMVTLLFMMHWYVWHKTFLCAICLWTDTETSVLLTETRLLLIVIQKREWQR